MKIWNKYPHYVLLIVLVLIIAASFVGHRKANKLKVAMDHRINKEIGEIVQEDGLQILTAGPDEEGRMIYGPDWVGDAKHVFTAPANWKYKFIFKYKGDDENENKPFKIMIRHRVTSNRDVMIDDVVEEITPKKGEGWQEVSFDVPIKPHRWYHIEVIKQKGSKLSLDSFFYRRLRHL